MSERSSLQRLFEGASPPSSLRQRVLASAHVRRPGRRRTLAALAFAATLLVGFIAGRMTDRIPAAADPQYLILLYEGAGYRDDRPQQETVAEYRRWADSLRREQLLAQAHKLDDERILMARDANPSVGRASMGDPTGLFIVRAESRDRAMTIAGTSPHLKYGGEVVVRRLQ